MRGSTVRGATPGFAREALILVAGTGLGQVLWLAVLPVLARQYDDESFGQLGVFLALSGILAVILTWRYDALVVAERETAWAWGLVRLALMLAAAGAAALGAALLLVPRSVTASPWAGSLGTWIAVTVLAGLLAAVAATGQAWLNRLSRVGAIATAKVLQGGALAGAALLLAVVGVEDGMLFAQLVGAAVGAGVVVVTTHRWRPRGLTDRPMRTVARRHSNAPRYLLPGALLDVASTAVPVLLISGWFGTAMAGQYSLAWRVLIAPTALVGAAVGQVFYRRFARAIEGVEDPGRLLAATWRTLLLIGLPGSVMLTLAGPEVFAFVFSPRWSSAGLMASLLAPMVLAMFVSSPTSTMYLVLGLERFTLWFGIASIVSRPAALAIGWWADNVYVGIAAWSFVEIAKIAMFNILAVKALGRATAEG